MTKTNKEKLIHFPFYCNQYLGIMSELTAKERGFWITLLATYIASDGVFPPEKRLYKRCDVCDKNDEQIINELLPEIEEIGDVILKTQKKKSKKLSENGRLGGLAKAKQKLSKCLPNGVAKSCHTETETDTYTEIDKDTEKEKEKKNIYSDEFESFWKAYLRPSKGVKKDAYVFYRKLSDEDKINALNGIKPYSKTMSELKYMKQAERYLRDRVWEGLDAPSQEQTDVYNF